MQNEDLSKHLQGFHLFFGKFVAVVFLLFIVGVLIALIVWHFAKRDAQKACALAPIGAEVAEVRAALSRDGYKRVSNSYKSDNGGEEFFVMENFMLEGYLCVIRNDGNKVIGTEVQSAD